MCSSVRNGVEDPPGVHAFSRFPPSTPPAWSSSSTRNGVPIGTSWLPGRSTFPETVNILVPGDLSVPRKRNHSAPLFTMCGTLQSVSTLLITVGLA